MGVASRDILEAVAGGQRSISVSGLCGSSPGYLVSRLIRKFPSKSVLIISPTAHMAERLSDDARLLCHPDDISHLHFFPPPDVLPYTRLSPDAVVMARRIEVLFTMLRSPRSVVFTSIDACLRRLPPVSFVAHSARIIRVKENIDRETFISDLISLGYEDVPLVEDEGAFACRGGIIDFWPPTSPVPLRLELSDHRIETLRTFRPATQRSMDAVSEILLIPVREFSFSKASREKATTRLRQRADDIDLPANERRSIIESLREGMSISGIDTLLPLFHDTTASLLEYFSGDLLMVTDDGVTADDEATQLERHLHGLATETRGMERLVAPEQLFFPLSQWKEMGKNFQQLEWNGLSAALDASTVSNIDIRKSIEGRTSHEEVLAPFAERLESWLTENIHVMILCHNTLSRDRVSELLKRYSIRLLSDDRSLGTAVDDPSSSVRLCIGKLSGGFRWMHDRLIIITDEEIFGTKQSRKSSARPPSEVFSSFTEIAPGDLLVHEHHGIGHYKGITSLTIQEARNDYLVIEYLGNDKLYLPVYRMNLVQRYVGPGDGEPPLDRLGGVRWAELSKKVRRELHSIAKELLTISAKRALNPGFAFPPPDVSYQEFADAFAFDETPDQLTSITDTMKDLELPRPMDRLICGDVGFGKTEVAMRAAFRAVAAGKQVAVIVPTTILAFQHHVTFTERFQGSAVSIDMLSRFRTRREQKETLERIKKGTVDIVIGTHRLLQRDIAFRSLGLLIIDEEHRFGVMHKEKLKLLRAHIDVLTLSATPIPRTLNMALAGLRDVSIIATPPADRHAISTHIAPFDPATIRHAIATEISRGGQVFFVHNRVQTIDSMHHQLSSIVPQARIAIAHGQMAEGKLESVMVGFLKKEYDVLLCTTIIESGLDIHNANTILIHRADTFGLAQLYQLRGRVGRSERHAFCYLLVPQEAELSAVAKRRLAALTRFTELGSGFQIAMHDLEIRGAGNLLGRAQSGHVADVGYELYTTLLARAIRHLKGEASHEEDINPELHLGITALLPPEYVPDESSRIDLYRRLARVESEGELETIKEELIDRFGPLPQEAWHLIAVMDIQMMARTLCIETLSVARNAINAVMHTSTPLTPQDVLTLLAKHPQLSLKPPRALTCKTPPLKNDEERLHAVKNFLSQLLACVSAAL